MATLPGMTLAIDMATMEGVPENIGLHLIVALKAAALDPEWAAAVLTAFVDEPLTTHARELLALLPKP